MLHTHTHISADTHTNSICRTVEEKARNGNRNSSGGDIDENVNNIEL